MEVFSAPNVKVLLILLECHTESDSRTKHHLRAAHIIVHNVLESWHLCLWIYQVEVYELISGDLDSHITLYEINLTPHLL